MQLWLESNLEAHHFISKDYWLSNYDMVQNMLQEAEIYIWEEEGKILGFAGMTDEFLSGIFVDKNHRSIGIGRQLLAHIKRNYPVITLGVYRENRRAVNFYFREGFSVISGDTEPSTGAYEFTMRWKKSGESADDWTRLYQAARNVLNPRKVSRFIEAGQVSAALLTDNGHIYTGICIDTPCSLGMCAERNAIAHMLTCGESRIVKLAAVSSDGSVVLPCGACCELMMQLNDNGGDIEILSCYPQIQVKRLTQMIPYWWGDKRS